MVRWSPQGLHRSTVSVTAGLALALSVGLGVAGAQSPSGGAPAPCISPPPVPPPDRFPSAPPPPPPGGFPTPPPPPFGPPSGPSGTFYVPTAPPPPNVEPPRPTPMPAPVEPLRILPRSFDANGNPRLESGMTAVGGQTFRLGDCLLAVPSGMTLRFSAISTTPSRAMSLLFVDVDSGSELVLDASTREEIARSVRGPAAGQATWSRFDALVASFRFSLEPPPPPGFDSSGNPRVLPKMTMDGGRTYRMGNGDWLLTVPSGMTLRFESVVASGFTGFTFVDVTTGSELSLNASKGGEVARTLRGPTEGQSLLNSRFDAVVASFRRSPEPTPIPARSGAGLRAKADSRWTSGSLAIVTLLLVLTARLLTGRGAKSARPNAARRLP